MIAICAVLITAPSLLADDIHDAAARGDVKEIEKLLSTDKSLLEKKAEWTNEIEGWHLEGTPLHIAAIEGQDDAVVLLIAKGAEVNVKDETGYTPLHLAAAKALKKTVEILLGAKNVNVNAETDDKKTPLLLAVSGLPVGQFPSEEQRLAVAELLLAKGANPNKKDDKGVTTLHIAAANGWDKLVNLLVSKGPDVNAVDNDGKTPLQAAEKSLNPEVAEILKKAGAK